MLNFFNGQPEWINPKFWENMTADKAEKFIKDRKIQINIYFRNYSLNLLKGDIINPPINPTLFGNIGFGTTPLMLASYFTTVEVINTLIKAGSEINAQNEFGETPLMFATAGFNSTPDIIATLIKERADVNMRRTDGMTPLMFASQYKTNSDIINTLIEAKANINARSMNGMTPLMFASFYNSNPDVVTTLINARASINACDSLGNTPLIHAVSNIYRNGIPYPFSPEAKADANVQNISKSSLQINDPLLNATSNVIIALIKKDADVNIKNQNGNTAWDLIQNSPLLGSEAYWELHDKRFE